jgi:hypothetical protein
MTARPAAPKALVTASKRSVQMSKATKRLTGRGPADQVRQTRLPGAQMPGSLAWLAAGRRVSESW